LILIVMPSNRFGMPSDIFGALPHEVIVASLAPEFVQLLGRKAPVLKQINGEPCVFL
jgi:hypothetical protein